MTERDAVVSAIRAAPNLTEAAHKLGSSRRTLQNRMRLYRLAPGKPGRPREPLPYRDREATDSGAGVLVGVVAALGLGYLAVRWLQSKPTTVVGQNPYVLGAAVLAGS